ncbi:hypothetical protein [Marinobacterium weihaiense]|nr:hypothetical protein [Marinobacterium weihaiense]
MIDTCEVSAFLMSLSLEQLEKIKLDLEKKVEQKKQQQNLETQKPRSRIPPTYNDLDALAANTGLDLSGLIKDIKRRS